MPSTIRRATIADLDFLFRLEVSLFPEDRRESRRSIARSLQSEYQEVWVASMEDGLLVGMVVLRFYQKVLRIYSIGVLADFQGEGLARRMLQWSEDRARERGCERMSLEVDSSQKWLVEFYRRQGYEVVRRLEDYYSPGVHGLRMSKRVVRVAEVA